MDEIDRAQEVSEIYQAEVLRAHFARRNPPMPPLTKGEENCIDCGEEIDPARREAIPGAIRCVECQAGKERRERLGVS